MIEFIKLICRKCKKERKFVVGTPREKNKICGECYDWEEQKK